MSEMHTIQLEAYDDHVSVRDRLAFAEARQVLLILPDTPILQRKLDLLLIQRQAARLGLHLALITTDPVVEQHARELNLSLFPDEQTAAQARRWKRPRDKVFLPPRDPLEQTALADHIYRQREAAITPARLRRRRLLRWAMFGGVIAALLLGFLVAAPSATVRLTPASRQVYETVTITADPAVTDIDIEQHQIPASVVTLRPSSRVTIQASGSETAGATLAQGIVTFTNTGDQAVLIPLGTVIATSDTLPIRFETMIDATLTAGDGASVQVPVQALEQHSGAPGNVGPGAINRIEADFGDYVTVTNPNATYGGAIQQQATVTAQDYERLLGLGRGQALQRARDLLLHQLAGDQFLVPGSLTIIEERPEWTNYSALVGDATESVSLDFQAVVQAVVVDERLAERVAYAGLVPYIQPGLEISQDALRFSRGDILNIEPNGRVTFVMVVSGNIAVSIDEDHVRDRVAGLTVSAARGRLIHELTLSQDRPVMIETWPGWLGRMPFLPVRITVEVQSP